MSLSSWRAACDLCDSPSVAAVCVRCKRAVCRRCWDGQTYLCRRCYAAQTLRAEQLARDVADGRHPDAIAQQRWENWCAVHGWPASPRPVLIGLVCGACGADMAPVRMVAFADESDACGACACGGLVRPVYTQEAIPC